MDTELEILKSDVNKLSIADGLKEALVKSGLTRQKILSYSTTKLASILDVDEYVASIIMNAAQLSSNPLAGDD